MIFVIRRVCNSDLFSFQDVGNKKRAVEMTKIAIELKPEMAPAHNNYGRALENDDQLEAALAAYYK